MINNYYDSNKYFYKIIFVLLKNKKKEILNCYS